MGADIETPEKSRAEPPAVRRSETAAETPPLDPLRHLLDDDSLLADVLNNSPIPIFIKSRVDTFVFANRAFLTAMRRTQSEVLGRSSEDLLGARVAQHSRNDDELTLSTGEVVHRQETVWLTDGVEHTFKVVKFPVRDSEGNVLGVCGLTLDVSDSISSERIRVAERERIALEIHDDAVQVMAATALRLDALQRSLVNEKQRETLRDIQEGVTEATERLRGVLSDLYTRLPQRDLRLAIENLACSLRDQHGISLTLTNGLTENPEEKISTLIFDLLKEALQNVAKHAKATGVEVLLARRPDGIQLSVSDDGVGFEPTESPDGHLGLTSMRSRVTSAGGRFDIQSSTAGTCIEIWLPEPAESRPI